MHTYIGTKIIQAKPMSRSEYNQYRGWALPADEDRSDEGFLVEYLDGGQSNHPDHKGYISWSPKEVFEQAYVDIGEDISDLPPFHQRLQGEAAELEHRIGKLAIFIESEGFSQLSNEQQSLLVIQINAMHTYLAVLNARIAIL